MPDHHTVVHEMKQSKAVIAQMGKPATALGAKIDAIAAEMDRAVQLRDGYNKCETLVAAAKKAADDQSKKVDDAKKKSDDAHTKHVELAKDLEDRAKKLEANAVVKDPKNKAIADAVNRLHFFAVSRFKQKAEYWDSDFYKTQADECAKYRKALPKPDSSNKLPPELGQFEDKVDALTKQFQDAMNAAKTADQLHKDSVTKSSHLDEMQKKVKPLEDQLGQLIGKITTDLNDAKQINADLDHTGSTEAFRRAEAIFKVLNDGLADYAGSDGKALDTKTWAAKP